MEKKNPAIRLILTAILISTFALVQPAIACHHSDPQDITVQQASYMINQAHHVMVLDVRNESEYNLGHEREFESEETVWVEKEGEEAVRKCFWRRASYPQHQTSFILVT